MPKTVAVFRIGQLGDTVVAFPAIFAIHAAYSGSRFILITDEHSGRGFVSSWDLLQAAGIFSEVLFYAPVRSCPTRFLNSALLAWKLRRLRTEVLFYLAPFPRTRRQVRRDTNFFRKVCGIREVYGLEATDHLARQRGKDGLLARIPSETDRLLSIVRSAQLTVPAPETVYFALPMGEKERSVVDRYWKEADLARSKGPIIGVGPGSKMPVKRWPHDRFIAVMKTLIRDIPETRFIILGGPEDEDLGLQVSVAVGAAAVNWAGRLTVLESAEVLRRCVLFLGNDSGLMHLAAAVGTKCVALFSARDNPGKWYPYGEGHIVLRKHVPCEGCLLVQCDEHDMACLKEIGSAEVSTACLAALGRQEKQSVLSL